MTARDIQRRLVVERYHRSFVICNFTPTGWFEADVMEITKAGFFVEYEVKLSASDFKADGKKVRKDWNHNLRQMVDSPTKHQMLRARSVRGPSRFWFVLPEGVVDLADIPVWAGVMRAHEQRGGWGPYRVRLRIERKAMQLHRAKIDPAVKERARESCYWRLHGLFCFGKTVDSQPSI